MISLYEDMGHIIKRYFDVADTGEQPTVSNDQIQESVMEDWETIENFDWQHKNERWSVGFSIGEDIGNRQKDDLINIVGKVFGGDIDREDIDDEKYGNVIVNIPDYYVRNKSLLKKFKEAIVKKYNS